MNNPGLIKNFKAGADIAPYRIVKFGSDDDSMIQSTGATDDMLGVSDSLGANAGDRVDVILTGACEVEYGGTVTRGKPLTSDSEGRAVQAAPAAGTKVNIIGYAAVSGVSGDIGSVRIAPGVFTEPA